MWSDILESSLLKCWHENVRMPYVLLHDGRMKTKLTGRLTYPKMIIRPLNLEESNHFAVLCDTVFHD